MGIENKESIKIDLLCDHCHYHFDEINSHILSKIKCNNCLFIIRKFLKEENKQILQLLENIEFYIYNIDMYIRNMTIAEYPYLQDK